MTGNGFDAGDRFLQFGLPGDQPVSGDWNKDGKDTPAFYRTESGSSILKVMATPAKSVNQLKLV